jgi:hypothetical protein
MNQASFANSKIRKANRRVAPGGFSIPRSSQNVCIKIPDRLEYRYLFGPWTKKLKQVTRLYLHDKLFQL